VSGAAAGTLAVAIHSDVECPPSLFAGADRAAE
jgi:hypothetical protein